MFPIVRAWWGDVRMEARVEGAHIAADVPANSPAYAAGLDRDDMVTHVDGARVSSLEEVNAALSRHKPGDRVQVNYLDRESVSKSSTVVLAENPHVDIVDAPGGMLTPEQRAFRDAWLSSHVRP